MMIKHTATKNNFFGKHYSPAGAGDSKSRDYRPEDYYKPEEISRFITGMKLK